MNDESASELTMSEKLFKAVMPWCGLVGMGVSGFYLLERNQNVPWYVFGLFGIMMGLGKIMLQLKDMKP